MPATVQRAFSGAPWEGKAGYCRAVRSGSFIAVAGTTAVTPAGKVHSPSNMCEQAKRILEIIEAALKDLGADRQHVIRTRMFVTDICRWEEAAKAHGEFFASCPPAATMVEVKALIDPELCIEIEADASLES